MQIVHLYWSFGLMLLALLTIFLIIWGNLMTFFLLISLYLSPSLTVYPKLFSLPLLVLNNSATFSTSFSLSVSSSSFLFQLLFLFSLHFQFFQYCLPTTATRSLFSINLCSMLTVESLWSYTGTNLVLWWFFSLPLMVLQTKLGLPTFAGQWYSFTAVSKALCTIHYCMQGGLGLHFRLAGLLVDVMRSQAYPCPFIIND